MLEIWISREFFFQGTLKAQLSNLLKIGYYTSKTVLFKLKF